jgi:NitT/TauT family transport system substrate-binding protein
MLRCAQSPRSNVLTKYASARRFFARLASEIFLSSLQAKFLQQPPSRCIANPLRILASFRPGTSKFSGLRKIQAMHSLPKSNHFLLGILIAFTITFVQPVGAATRDIERIRVGYSVGGLIPFPVVVAQENKFFEHLGLDVELINIPPTLAVTALVSGDSQYVIFAGTTLNAAVRGLPVKLVMVYNDRPLFSLMSRPEIRSIKEMKGKVLGVASLTSGESFLSRRLLKEAGVDPERDVTVRSIGNTPDRLIALRTGVVDATTLTVPVDIQAEKQGLRRLAFMGEILESINGGLGVSERWIQQRPDQIRKMITAVFRGMAHAREHRQESITLVMSKWKMERDIAEKAFDLMLKTWSDNGQASDPALQAGIEESLKVSSNKQTVALSRVADFNFVREVYRELREK